MRSNEKSGGGGAIRRSTARSRPADVAKGYLEKVRRHQARFAEFWFTELGGRPRRVTIGADAVDDRLFANGLTLDGASTGPEWRGLVRIDADPDSVLLDPIAAGPTIAIFGEVAAVPEGRAALRRAEGLLRERGIADVASIGAEGEFFLVEPATGLPAAESVVWDLLREIAAALERAEIEPDGFRAGPGAGQGRVQMRSAPALRTADRMIFYRAIVRALARRSGREASFLPRPFVGSVAGGMPIHVALWRDGENVFHDEHGAARASAVCRSFAAGVLEHAAALAAICAPSTNSWVRFLAAETAPTALELSTDSPRALCRIPARSPAPAARRIKIRLPDGTSNPYLALAAVLAAGIDGVERKLDPQSSRRSDRLPRSFEAALDALESDRGFLERNGVFASELLDAWIEECWTRRILPVRSEPHPAELRLEREFER
jgi:glutamine synthetase